MQTGDADRSLRERPNGLCSPGGSHPCTQNTGGMHVAEAPANEGREERACSAPGTCWRLLWDRGTDEGWWIGVTVLVHKTHISKERIGTVEAHDFASSALRILHRGGGDKDSLKPVILQQYKGCFINTAVKSKTSRICTKYDEKRDMDQGSLNSRQNSSLESYTLVL